MSGLHIQSSGWLAHAITAILTAVTTLIGSYFAFNSVLVSTEPTMIGKLYERMETLESKYNKLSNEFIQVKAENSILRLKVDVEFKESPRATLFKYVEAIGSPAWCKIWDQNISQFSMLYINSAYEHEYGISKGKYIGSTDYSIYSTQLAKAYERSDKLILDEKKFIKFKELTLNGYRTFWKFYIKLPDRAELICGIQVD